MARVMGHLIKLLDEKNKMKLIFVVLVSQPFSFYELVNARENLIHLEH